MAAVPTLASNATEAQAVAYLSAFWGSATYSNSTSTPYNGKNATQLYAYIAQQNPSASPYSIAVSVSDLLLSSETGSAIGSGANEGLGDISQSATAAANPANYPSLPSWLSGLGDFAGFLQALGSANTWIRVGKVVIGGVLIIVGAAHLTGAGGAVKEIASKVPVIP